MEQRISLAMIVRDEERCLQRCLDSVSGVVDEIVVVDTGSVDSTADIARGAGARVLQIAWPDDFAVARNVALDACTGDWRLVLDADEWLAEGADVIAALAGREPSFVGALEVASTFVDEQGEVRTAPDLLPRVLPAAVRYAGRIHEQPVHELPVERLAVRVGHDGYEPGPMQGKGDRNAVLLAAALREHPDDPYLHYQLGKDHEVHERFAEACTHYDTAYRLGSPSAGWRQDLVVRLMFCLKKAGRSAAAMDLAEVEIDHRQDSADFFFCLGDVLLDHALAHPQEAGRLLPMIEGSWQRCLALGDGDAATGAVQGRGSHLAAHNLAALYESLGRTGEAREYRRQYHLL